MKHKFYERIKTFDYQDIKDNKLSINFQIISIQEEISETIVKHLYETTKKMGINDLMIVSEKDFKDFLLKYLPKYNEKGERKMKLLYDIEINDNESEEYEYIAYPTKKDYLDFMYSKYIGCDKLILDLDKLDCIDEILREDEDFEEFMHDRYELLATKQYWDDYESTD